MILKRCICKRSASYPLCDGSHQSATWCQSGSTSNVECIVIYSQTLGSFAEWFAITHNYTLYQKATDLSNVSTVWVLFDGTDMDLLTVQLRRLPHPKQSWIHIGSVPYLSNSLAPFIGRSTHYHVEDIDITKFDINTLQPCPLANRQSQTIFLSHSIQDEYLILPVVERLQEEHDLELFLCAHMPTNVDWYQTIEHNLQQSDAVWIFCSTHINQSTFCAFEIGMARGLDKVIVPISLDASPPPLYVQHRNISSIKRLQLQKPWLSPEQALHLLCTKLLYTSTEN